MIPWERDIYLSLLRQHIEEENLTQQAVQIVAYSKETFTR